jgi:hypothetical protein
VSCISGCSVTRATDCPITINIVITWANYGINNGTFTPWITIAGGDKINGVQMTVVPGKTGTTTFTGINLPQGTQNVCIDNGTIT